MPNVDDIKDFVKTPKKPKAAVKLMGGNEDDNVTVEETAVTNEDIVINETAATNEEPESSNELDESIAKAFAGDTPPKREKVLKGIYLDEDVLKVYNKAAKDNGRGWGSQLVSDLLRKEFIRRGIKIDPQ